MKRLAVMACAVASLAVGGCSEAGPGETVAATVTPSPTRVVADGIFGSTTPPPSGGDAFAYDGQLVPRSAAANLILTAQGGQTQALLTVSGFLTNRGYGAHLNVNPCGVDPQAAGATFQHSPDPAASSGTSTNPTFANPTNEIWVDFTSDRQGNGSSSADVPWVATSERHPRSLVIYSDLTMTAPGQAGTAGRRVACLTIP